MYSIAVKKDTAHDEPIYCCWWAKTRITEDFKDFIVTGGLDGLVKIWQLNNNKLELLSTLHGHSMAIVSIAVSPDGHTIASTSLDSSLIIWDLTSGSKVHEIETGAIDAWKVVFSPDGTKVASGSHTGKVTVYGVEKGTVDSILDTRGQFAVAIAWSSNDKYIATGSVDGTVCIFDVSQRKILHTIDAHTKTVRSINFNFTGNQIISASDDGFVKVYDVASAGLVCKILLKSWAMSAAFSKDGKCIAIGAADGSVKVNLTENSQELHSFNEHSDVVCCIQFNEDSSKLLSVSKDKSIIIYDCPPAPKISERNNKTTLIK